MTPIHIPSRENLITLLKTFNLSSDQFSDIYIKLKFYEADMWNTAVEHSAKICDNSSEHLYDVNIGDISKEFAKRIRALKAYQTIYNTENTCS